MAKKHPKKANIDRILDQNIAKIRRKRASKNNSRPIILDNTILFEVITELDSVVRGGATGKTKELAQNLSVKARRQAKERKAATEERLKRVKNIRKKLEEKQKEESFKLKKAREDKLNALKGQIATLDEKIAAATNQKEIKNRTIKRNMLQTKLDILTKDMASNRPLKAQIELERRIKQAKKIEEAEEGIDKLIEKLAEMQATNKDNRWEEQISRITQQIQNTEQEVNKSATNLADFLDKQFYSNIWQQKLDAEKEDYILGTRIPQPRQPKTINDKFELLYKKHPWLTSVLEVLGPIVFAGERFVPGDKLYNLDFYIAQVIADLDYGKPPGFNDISDSMLAAGLLRVIGPGSVEDFSIIADQLKKTKNSQKILKQLSRLYREGALENNLKVFRFTELINDFYQWVNNKEKTDTATDEPESEEPLYTVPKDVDPYWERPENISGNVDENKKTISNITDRLMEQLYDTLN